MEDKDEIYVVWNATESITGRCKMLSLYDSKEGLSLLISAEYPDVREVEFKFDLKDVVGYKFANDSYTWRSDAAQKRKKDWSIFKVEDSRYLQWFKDETYNAVNLSGATHFSFLLEESGVDIVSLNDPEVIVRIV